MGERIVCAVNLVRVSYNNTPPQIAIASNMIELLEIRNIKQN